MKIAATGRSDEGRSFQHRRCRGRLKAASLRMIELQERVQSVVSKAGQSIRISWTGSSKWERRVAEILTQPNAFNLTLAKNPALRCCVLFMIYPLGVVEDVMGQRIVDDALDHLQGEYGIRRYLGDAYWTADYKDKVPAGERTVDVSERQEGETLWLRLVQRRNGAISIPLSRSRSLAIVICASETARPGIARSVISTTAPLVNLRVLTAERATLPGGILFGARALRPDRSVAFALDLG